MSRQKGDIMTISDRLLNLEFHRLEVWRTSKNNVCVAFQRCEVKDGAVLASVFGEGLTFGEACEDYLRQISGKTLVFDACTDKRKEVIVL